MKTATTLVILFCFSTGAALAQSPSLVDLAKKEQERRKTLKGSAAKV